MAGNSQGRQNCFTETWSNNLGVLDPATGQVTKWAGTGGNKDLLPMGSCGEPAMVVICVSLIPRSRRSPSRKSL